MPADQPSHREDNEGKQFSDIYRVAWLFYLLLAIAAVVWIGSRSGTLPIALVVDSSSWWSDILLGWISGLGLVSVWSLGRRYLESMGELERLIAKQISGLSEPEALCLAVISAFSEELFFRGAVQASWGWIWATLIFAVMHSGPGRIFRWWTLFAFVAGLVFAGLTISRGNILAAIVAHTVVNAINLRRLASMTGTDGGDRHA